MSKMIQYVSQVPFKVIKNVIYILISIWLAMFLSKDGNAQQFSPSTSNLINTNTTDAWNVSWADINGDGFDDLFVMEYANNTRNHVYINDGNGDFYEDFSSEALIDKVAGSLSSSWADIDNDGDRDVHVANTTGGPNFTIINNGDGTFTDNTANMNSTAVGYYHGSSWADYDNDGFVDLFTCSFFSTKYSELYHNNGDGTFDQVLNSPLSYLTGRSIGATWVDYDNDGWQDIFIPMGDNGDNALYHNVGNGTFEPVTQGDIVNDGSNSVASCWGDIDNDGDMDLFVSNTSEHNNFLYFNNGNGAFVKDTNDIVATDAGQTHGCNFIDVDNDGDLDLYTCNTGDQANKLYLNDGAGNFTVSTDSVVDIDYGQPYSQAWSDFDKDGDMDLFVSTQGNHEDHFFINNSTGNHWLNVKLKGTNSNYSGVGSTIKVKANGVWQMRQVNSQTGFGSQNSLHQHFGLGAASIIDSMLIKWSSGYVQYLTNVTVDQFLNVEEDNAALVSGFVYNDVNGNCQKDAGEDVLSGVQLKIEPGDIYTATNEFGQYSVNLPIGNYLVKCDEPEYWESECTDEIPVTVTQVGQVISNVSFGMEADESGPDLSVVFSAVAQRRGFSNFAMITYTNSGTEADYNRWIELKVPDGIYITSASIPWTQVIGYTYLWQLDTINPGDFGTIILTDSVGLELSVGDSVLFHTSITTFQDLNTANDAMSSIEVIVGAVDPNDIQVSPKGFGEEGFVSKTDTLQYRIRFQNVGSYQAQNIYITDSLPAELDPTSVKMEAMSHNGNWWIEGNTIFWKFNNINLPDSTSDETGSHGFVLFSIVPKTNVDPGVEVINQASIEFDFESPVSTNTTFNTIKTLSSEEDNVLEIFPNPARTHTTFRLKRNREMFDDNVAITEYRIMDLSGKLIASRSDLSENEIVFDGNSLRAGTYIITAKDASGTEHFGKIVLTKGSIF